MKTSLDLILNRLDDAGKKQLFKDVNALINFNFESQTEEEFEDSVKPGLLRINEKLTEVYDAALTGNDEFIQDQSNLAFMDSISNENSKSLFKYYKELIDNYQKDSGCNSKSLYNTHYFMSTTKKFLSLGLIYEFYNQTFKLIQIEKLTDMNFNDNDNSFNKFKDLCKVVHAVRAFQVKDYKKHLSVICNDDYQLDNEKINNLYKKFQLIADKDTGKISKEKLAEYTSDRTVMDFIRMILSYLPQVIKDAIGLNEELGKKWQNKVALKPIIIESERLGMF